ncbi:MAG: hypothetical protein OXU20_07990, partial [Myxococcales bacterium]|nr:hypothetical protein [Myxococcales bacterium]
HRRRLLARQGAPGTPTPPKNQRQEDEVLDYQPTGVRVRNARIPVADNSSTTVLTEFHLVEWKEGLKYVQPERFRILAKPWWFTAAAYALVTLIQRAWARPRAPNHAEPKPVWATPARRFAFSALLAFLVTPIVLSFLSEYWHSQVIHQLQPESSRRLRDERQQFVEWMRANHPQPSPFFRVGVVVDRRDNQFADLGTELDVPVYILGFVPASPFVFKVGSASAAILQAVNVRYILAPHRLGKRKKLELPVAKLNLVKRFGALRLYEYEDWARQPFAITEGSGDVELERFDNEQIVLRAAPGSKGRLRVNVSSYPRWRATLNGAKVPIRRLRVDNDRRTGFMSVALKPGRYVFAFRRGLSERLSPLLLLIGLVGAFGLVTMDGKRFRLAARVGQRLQATLDACERAARQHGRWALVASGIVGVSAVAILARLALYVVPVEPGRKDSWRIERVHYDFTERLRDATVSWTRGQEPHRNCGALFDDFRCGADAGRHVRSQLEELAGRRVVRCVGGTLPDHGELRLVYPEVPAGQALVGYVGLPRDGARAVEFEVQVGAQPIYRQELKQRSEFRRFFAELSGEGASDVTFSVRTQGTRRSFCFHAQIVKLKQEAS